MSAATAGRRLAHSHALPLQMVIEMRWAMWRKESPREMPSRRAWRLLICLINLWSSWLHPPRVSTARGMKLTRASRHASVCRSLPLLSHLQGVACNGGGSRDGEVLQRRDDCNVQGSRPASLPVGQVDVCGCLGWELVPPSRDTGLQTGLRSKWRHGWRCAGKCDHHYLRSPLGVPRECLPDSDRLGRSGLRLPWLTPASTADTA